MDADELTRLEQLAAAATAGPWAIDPNRELAHGPEIVGVVRADRDYQIFYAVGMCQRNDAAFIAAARAAVPALVAEVRRLQQDTSLLSDAKDGYKRRVDQYRRRALALREQAEGIRYEMRQRLEAEKINNSMSEWRLDGKNAELRAENVQLRAALEAVEYNTDHIRFKCPWCGGYDPERLDPKLYGAIETGHHSDCQRQRALNGGEQ